MKALSLELKIKKCLRKAVQWLEKILPERSFDNVYKVSFPVYKGLVRYLYFLNGLIRFAIVRDKNELAMIKRIFRVMPYSLVGVGGLEATYKAVKDVYERGIAGEVVELGVARGGCAMLMASIVFDKRICGQMDRKLWLFDSYEGLPEPTSMDFSPELGNGTGEHVRPLTKGACLGQLDEVKDLMFNKNDFPRERVEFVKGWFENTLPKTREKIKQIAVLRIDADWYESTKSCLVNLYDKVCSGGYVIVDDYQSCYGCRRAVDEFIQDRHIVPVIKFDGRGGCYFRKE